jgi:ribokinase
VSDAPRRILVVGGHAPGVLIRVPRIPVTGETVIARDYSEPLDGGKGSNQAIAAARLGGSVGFVGRLGNDARGDLAADLMRDAGVQTRWTVRSTTQPTGTGVNLLDDEGTPAMVSVLGANAELSDEDVDRALDGSATDTIVLVDLEIPVEVALHALRSAHEREMLTLLNAAPAIVDITDVTPDAVDVLVVNEVEARTLLAGDEVAESGQELATALRDRTAVRDVVVTLGPDGHAGHDEDGAWSEPAHAVSPVDTSGAGDVFCAALAVQLAAGQKLRDACAWASFASAVSITRPGTIEGFPTVLDVDRLRGLPAGANSRPQHPDIP